VTNRLAGDAGFEVVLRHHAAAGDLIHQAGRLKQPRQRDGLLIMLT